MKKILTMLAALFLLCSGLSLYAQDKAKLEKNKAIAVKFHELKAEDVDALIAEDFVGRSNDMTWTRENHRQALNTSHKTFKSKDKILSMVAEGDLVALSFVRSGEWEGKPVELDMMQFMRISDGLIVEIWEAYDQKKADSLME